MRDEERRGVGERLLVADRLVDSRRDAIASRLQVVLERFAVALELPAEVVDLPAETGAVALAFFGALLVVALDLEQRFHPRAESADVLEELANGARLRGHGEIRALRRDA